MSPEALSLEAALARCTQCGACRPGCPSFDLTLAEGDSGRGRAMLTRAVLEGVLEPDATVLNFLSRCTGCGFCEQVCPTAVPVTSGIARVRAAAAPPRGVRRFVFQRLLGPRWVLNVLVGALAVWQRLLFRSLGNRIEALPGLRTAKGLPKLPWRSAMTQLSSRKTQISDRRVRLQIGCRVNYLYPTLALETVRLLESHQIAVDVPKGQHCTGLVPRGAGALDVAEEVTNRNQRAFLRTESEPPVLSLCASCRRGLTESGISPIDAVEFLAHEFLSRPARAVMAGRRIGIHSPCSDRHFGRRQESLIAVLRRAGAEVVLLAGAQHCCGGAVPFSVDESVLARSLGTQLLEQEARSSGVDTVVTGDPGCLLHLRECGAENGSRIAIVHGIEILVELLP